MSEESYTLIRDIPSGDMVRLDFRWVAKKGRITDFSINVSVLEDEKSIDVYRIDTKHGYVHEHRFWRSQVMKLDMDYNKAFAEKKKEVLENYQRWILALKKLGE